MPKTPNAITSTTQQFLDIYDITNDIVIMKSGAASMIVSVKAMNFGLLAEEEQDAIIYGYAGLLNSLNYPIQIVIRSQTKDVTGYLNLLKAKEEETVNRLRKAQIQQYREFVADLVQERNVLDKKFYLVITATALELGLVTTQSVLPGIKTPDISTFDRSIILERARNLLEPKRDHLMSQCARIGLYSEQLKTQDLIQLFYSIYNSEAEGQKMSDSRSYTLPIVQGTFDESIFGAVRGATPDHVNQKPVTPVASQELSPTPPPTQLSQVPPQPNAPEVSSAVTLPTTPATASFSTPPPPVSAANEVPLATSKVSSGLPQVAVIE
jgi:hypothetical protein